MYYFGLILSLSLIICALCEELSQRELMFQITLESLRNDSDVLLVRHANSRFNYEEQKLVEANVGEQEFKILRQREDLWDSPLSELGLTQGKVANKLVSNLDIGVVLISPLERALQSTELIFRNHPKYDSIKFIVTPLLRERLHTTCDIPKNTTLRIEKWKQIFPNLDTSLLEEYNDADHFYVADQDQEIRRMLRYSEKYDAYGKTICGEKDLFSPLCIQCISAFEHVINHIQAMDSEHLESIKNVLNRIEKVQQMIIKKYLRKSSESSEKIVLVGHSNFFKLWTGQWDNDISNMTNIPEPNRFKFLQNCEIVADPAKW